MKADDFISELVFNNHTTLTSSSPSLGLGSVDSTSDHNQFLHHVGDSHMSTFSLFLFQFVSFLCTEKSIMSTRPLQRRKHLLYKMYLT